MAPPHSWSRSPTSLTEVESQELGTAQHSLATLADGVRWSSPDSWLLLLSTEMLKWKDGRICRFPGRIFPCFVAQEIYVREHLCAKFLALPSLVSLPCLLFPVFLHMTALLNPITSPSLHVQLANQVLLDLPFVLCTQTFWVQG